MVVESKPLFHPEVIRQHLRPFILPDSVADSLPKLQHWAELIASGKADKLKETSLLPDFLTDIFVTLLGYTGPAGASGLYTLSRETHVEADEEGDAEFDGLGGVDDALGDDVAQELEGIAGDFGAGEFQGEDDEAAGCEVGGETEDGFHGFVRRAVHVAEQGIVAD